MFASNYRISEKHFAPLGDYCPSSRALCAPVLCDYGRWMVADLLAGQIDRNQADRRPMTSLTCCTEAPRIVLHEPYARPANRLPLHTQPTRRIAHFFLDPTVSNVTFVPAITNWLSQETERCRSQTWNNRQRCNGSTNRCNDHSARCS